MKPNQRIALTATVLAGIALTGITMALVWNNEPGEPQSGKLRPSISPDQQPTRPAGTASGDETSRFAYVPSNIGHLMLPPEGSLLPEQPQREEPGAVAANPETWAVDVNRRVVIDPDTSGSATARPPAPAPKRTKPSTNHRSLQERLKQIAPSAMPRLAAKFEAAKVKWPPTEIALVAIKDKKVLELYARSGSDKWHFIHRYRVRAASGASGPKLHRGDRQVPEGIYRISYLNPNSRYHVSLRVNYPNRFDRKMAAKDGRRDLGGDIMIHGKSSSAGCLAMGDKTAEELFVLAAEVGLANVKVIIAPTDLRQAGVPASLKGPTWLPQLYTQIAGAMSTFKAPPKPSVWSLLGLTEH